MGPYFVRIQGKATINGKPVVVDADVLRVRKAWRDWLFLRAICSIRWLGGTEKPPFSLLARFDPTESIRGLPISVIITVRDAGLCGRNVLSPQGLPANVTFPR